MTVFKIQLRTEPNGRDEADRFVADARKIKRTLRDYPEASVHMECWDRREADKIRAFLTIEEQARVGFTWLRWDRNRRTL